MKHSLIISVILFLTFGVSAQTFHSALNGAQEVPSNSSNAVGVGTVILNAAETNITVTLYLSGLSGAQTSAKIHNSGGIVFNLPGGNFSQGFAVSPAQVAELKAGLWYFNVNSANFPNGEIRGQINALSSNNAVPFPFSNGSLDATFDVDGIVTTDIGGGSNIAQSVAVQTDGKLVVAGFSRNSLNNDFAVARYNPNGSLDTTFDGDGIVTLSIGSGSELVRSIAVQTDGRIVVAGQIFNGTNNDIVVVRYNSDGTLDATFDGNSGAGNGIVTTAIGSGNNFGYGVAI